MTYRGLVVDFGGVLTTSITESFRIFCRREGIAEERLNDLLHASYRGGSDDSPVARVETGALTTEEFEGMMAELLSEGLDEPLPAGGLVARMLETVEPDPAMLAAVGRAREGGIRTALLSNAWSPRQYRIGGIDDGLFDAAVISNEVGMRKPSPEIYREAARRLDLDPGACVFVDDLRANVEAAERVGMRGILHERAEETIPLLQELLGVPLG